MNTGKSYGTGLVVFTGLRNAGNTVYVPAIPANQEAGIKGCRQQLRVTAFLNEKNSIKPNRFRLTAWGKLADTCAMMLAPGQEFDCKARPSSYMARVFDKEGNQVLLPDGSPAMTEKVSFSIVMDFQFGPDSQTQITKELGLGKRLPNWCDGGEGEKAWKLERTIKAATPYTPGMAEYGHARVETKGNRVVPVDTSVMTPDQLIKDPRVLAMLQAMASPQNAGAPAAAAAVNNGFNVGV